MSVPNSHQRPIDNNADPLVLYTRSLHNYTLALWAESRRIVEERARAHKEASSSIAAAAPVEPSKPQRLDSTSSVDTDKADQEDKKDSTPETVSPSIPSTSSTGQT
ncbi:hypothetical protein D9613_004139 [Agrocybe pediades]|uniref:Uncharacterized protein n=1 Tax=Agrocybe pediades TaxID=84607 RepID=A0A8H4QJH2_9AGAR|nr:hypothetical protein D9613_004139 [Agrocybe pediades]